MLYCYSLGSLRRNSRTKDGDGSHLWLARSPTREAEECEFRLCLTRTQPALHEGRLTPQSLCHERVHVCMLRVLRGRVEENNAVLREADFARGGKGDGKRGFIGDNERRFGSISLVN